MRSLHILLVITASLLASLAVSAEADPSTRTANVVENNKDKSRFLRDGGTTEAQTDEERATITLGDKVVSDKAATKDLLERLLALGTPLKTVQKEFLNMPLIKTFAELSKHPNWRALDKYERMQWQKLNEGQTLTYMRVGDRSYSKEKAQEQLLRWVAQKKTVKSVYDDLQIEGFARNTDAARLNWRAYNMYDKWFTAASQMQRNPQQYAKFGTGYHSEQKTTEVFEKWAMEGTHIKSVIKTLNLNNKSASEMANNENFPALLKYVKLYLDFKPFRDLNAKSRLQARRPIS
uniref:RxLR effector protein Avr4 n=1 Tax=Phytophthora mirabilis TaxID=129356 RepID=AVH4_PHYMI|nr:RecName: Full=RxLR effector protein Avr4; AltName: Full=Avirulence homolog protein 4; Flags: Precursor [Phytophthora mirabilis]ACR10586.1 avirulence-like protein 4 [Phytophthora mirabilis]